MSNQCLRPLAALVGIVCLGIPAGAQSTGSSTNFIGELRSEAPINYHDYWVELVDLGNRNDARRTDVQFDGGFQLRDIHSGPFTLRVTDLEGRLVHEELITVGPHTGILTVRLPEAGKKPTAGGTVSLNQLQHPPARKAFQAVLAAQRFSATGQTEKAAEELEKAIRISPAYADAYNNLAVQHIRLGRFEEAAGELARAIALGGASPVQLSNLAYAQYRMNRFEEAIASARAALRLDSSWPQAHLILGSILASDIRTRAESIAHLERAAETLPSARAMLERVRQAN